MIGLENSYFPLIHLSSCYRTVLSNTLLSDSSWFAFGLVFVVLPVTRPELLLGQMSSKSSPVLARPKPPLVISLSANYRPYLASFLIPSPRRVLSSWQIKYSTKENGCTVLHLGTYVNTYSSERSVNLPGYFFLRGKQKYPITSHAKPTLCKRMVAMQQY